MHTEATMNRVQNIVLSGAFLAIFAGCASVPENIEELQMARSVVPQVEASPRAGVAATYVSDARKALDRANRLADGGGDLDEIKHEAQIASLNAAIANERILTAEAQEQIEKGTAERQQVLIDVREREAQRRAQQAEMERQRASSLEQELSELKAKPTPRGMVLTLGDVLFDVDQS